MTRSNLDQKLGTSGGVLPGGNAVLDVGLLEALKSGHDREQLGQVVILFALPGIPEKLHFFHQLRTSSESRHVIEKKLRNNLEKCPNENSPLDRDD